MGSGAEVDGTAVYAMEWGRMTRGADLGGSASALGAVLIVVVAVHATQPGEIESVEHTFTVEFISGGMISIYE